MATVTDQIKEKIDIVEFISASVPLRKAGRHYVGFCPFHTNTRTPAFTVFPDSQSFHCFGCKASGTVFDFVMRREGLEFKDALEQLALRTGVELKPRTEVEEQQDALRTRLLEINAAAARFFQHMLLKSPRGEAARAYVAKRGLDAPTVEAFQIGYAPEEWSALLAYLTDRRGFEPEEIVAAGLAIQREQGGWYDRFRDRLMFPIRSAKGEIIAFGGRAFGDAQPKYMNSPQTALFDKSKTLYGFDLAREHIRNQEAAVIVEGYVDVIVAHQYGFRNVVAPLGTALTGDHVGVVKKLAKTIYLALDADDAGVRATVKGLHTLEENLDREMRPVTTPQGIIRWERDLDAGVKIIVLPDGKDPDEVIQAEPELWQRLVVEALPAMEFYIGALTADLDLQSAKGKAEAVRRLTPLVGQITNPTERAYYIDKIARSIEVDKSVVQSQVPAGFNPNSVPGLGDLPVDRVRPPRPGKLGMVSLAPNVPLAAAPDHEDYLLGWALRHPAVRVAVEEKLQHDLVSFPLVAELLGGTLNELFDRIESRAIYNAWLAQPDQTDLDQWAAELDESLRAYALRALELKVPEPQSYRYVNDALECATILQQHVAARWKDRVSRQITESVDDGERNESLERLVQLKAYLDALRIPRRSSTFTDLRSTLRTA